MHKRLIALLSAGHLFTDINQGALPALLPFLIASHHFTYARAAGLVFAMNTASSVAQPFFGALADRFPIPWLVPLGILTAGCGVMLTASVPQYALMLFFAALAGLGVAAFHPEAALLVSHMSGERRATAMASFSVGGTFGFAIGPLLSTAVLVWAGERGGMLLVVPSLLAAGLIFSQLGRLSGFAMPDPRHAAASRGDDQWLAFALLCLAVVSRSTVFFGLNTFLPLYWIDVLHQSKGAGNLALSFLLLCGCAGTLLGGALGDRYGRYPVFLTAMTLIPVVVPLLLLAPTASIATALLFPLGIVMFIPFGVMIVMGQALLPNHPGIASGVTMGLAASIGGLFTPLLGHIGDTYGLHASFSALTGVAVVALIFSALAVKVGNEHQR
jgi:FSR family fosmidomycin resistance protein-like MFS transporter